MRSQANLLLAEDEALIGMTLQCILEDSGFRVLHVLTAEEGLMQLRDDPASFMGLVTDIRLGVGIDGWELARGARELITFIPVVYMSGDRAIEHSSRGVTGSVMLQKPFAPALLLNAVANAVNAAPQRP